MENETDINNVSSTISRATNHAITNFSGRLILYLQPAEAKCSLQANISALCLWCLPCFARPNEQILILITIHRIHGSTFLSDYIILPKLFLPNMYLKIIDPLYIPCGCGAADD